ncbi:MAG: hypothetical protein AAF713_22170 [Pseudomonadota bacterium]
MTEEEERLYVALWDCIRNSVEEDELTLHAAVVAMISLGVGALAQRFSLEHAREIAGKICEELSTSEIEFICADVAGHA